MIFKAVKGTLTKIDFDGKESRGYCDKRRDGSGSCEAAGF